MQKGANMIKSLEERIIYGKIASYLSALVLFSMPHNIEGYPKEEYKDTINVQSQEMKSGNIDYDRRNILLQMPKSEKYLNAIIKLSQENDLMPEEVCALIEAESGWDNYAISGKRCMGLMQINKKYHKISNPFNSDQNLEVGINHLGRLKEKYKKQEVMYAAYNAGERNVNKWIRNGWNGEINGIPYRETRNYVKRIKSMLDKIGYKS